MNSARSEHGNVQLVPFSPQYAPAFKALNLAWIRKYWEPEPQDFEALDNPQSQVIDAGGYIAFAIENNSVLGTCALVKKDDANYELAKMAVSDSAQGRGIGLMLGEAIIEQAKTRGAKRVYLESNTILEPAINLYRKLGFKEFSGEASPYERCNIQMELLLETDAKGS